MCPFLVFRGDAEHSSCVPTPPFPVLQCNQEQSLQQKLLDEQFSILQETVREAEGILRDAMAKLDDPLHVRCTSSPGMPCSPSAPKLIMLHLHFLHTSPTKSKLWT